MTAEVTQITDALKETSADADAGPGCGTLEAVTEVWASYDIQGMTHVAHTVRCCARHVPAELPKPGGDAELVDVVIQDGVTRTTIRADGTSTVLVNLDYTPDRVDSFAPSWPNRPGVLLLDDFAITP